MNKPLVRLAMILFAVGALYYLFSDDEVAPETPSRPTLSRTVAAPPGPPPANFRPPEAAQQVPQSVPAPTLGSPSYSFRGTPRGNWDPGPSGGQAFRPLDRQGIDPQGGRPGAAPPPWRGDPAGSPDYRQEPTRRDYNRAHERDRRFRPLEERELSNRWQGGYQRMTTSPELLASP